MRLRHIEVFHAIYTTGSITQAAKRLNVSQPSVSKVLSHAEQQLGFELFERARGKLLATPEAEQLFPSVATLFSSLGEVRRVATNLRDTGEGKIRIAATPALSLDLIPRVVGDFFSNNPQVLFELETLHLSEIATALAESRIDLGVAFDPPPTPGVQAQTLAGREMVVIAPVSLKLPKETLLELEDLADLPFIALHPRSPLGHLLQAQIDAMDVTFDVVAVAETYHMAQSLVAQQIGVAIVDEITAMAANLDEIQVRAMKHPLTFDVCALEKEGAPTSKVQQKFVAHLKTLMSEERTPKI